MRKQRQFEVLLYEGSDLYNIDEVVASIIRDSEDVFLCTHNANERVSCTHKHLLVMFNKGYFEHEIAEKYGIPRHLVFRLRNWCDYRNYLLYGNPRGY